MAKKQKSFAEKASSKKGKDLVHVKFVKSVPSDKEGFWRFNESMIGLEKGQKLDAALKQMEDEWADKNLQTLGEKFAENMLY